MPWKKALGARKSRRKSQEKVEKNVEKQSREKDRKKIKSRGIKIKIDHEICGAFIRALWLNGYFKSSTETKRSRQQTVKKD